MSRICAADISDEVFRRHHKLVILVNAEIADVPLGILMVAYVEVLRTNTEVRLVVNHHLKRVKTVDEYPLPNIKFPFVDKEWSFNVFLHYLRAHSSLIDSSWERFFQLIEAKNPDPPRVITRLGNPNVKIAVNLFVLWHFLFQESVHFRSDGHQVQTRQFPTSNLP